jgi:hypothetical protein
MDRESAQENDQVSRALGGLNSAQGKDIDGQ